MSKKERSNAVFHTPFEGKPAPLSRVGLFAFSPDVHLKLYSVGTQREITTLGLAAAWKRLTRFLRKGSQDEAKGMKLMAGVLEEFSAKLGDQPQWEELNRALAGDAAAKAMVEERSRFEWLFRGFDTGPEDWREHHYYLIALERAGITALHMGLAGDLPGTAAYIATQPLLRHLLWPEAYEAFKCASQLDDLRALIFAMSVDAHLGFLAAWDVHLATGGDSVFRCVMPSSASPGDNPTSLFYDELQRRLGKDSIGQVLSSFEGSRTGLDQSTLNRWSAGTHSPDLATLHVLLDAYGLKRSDELLYPQFWCAKNLNMLGHYTQRLVDAAHLVAGSPEVAKIWPWPNYPFGHKSFEAWVADRYPYWLSYHRKHSEEVKALALPQVNAAA